MGFQQHSSCLASEIPLLIENGVTDMDMFQNTMGFHPLQDHWRSVTGPFAPLREGIDRGGMICERDWMDIELQYRSILYREEYERSTTYRLIILSQSQDFRPERVEMRA